MIEYSVLLGLIAVFSIAVWFTGQGFGTCNGDKVDNDSVKTGLGITGMLSFGFSIIALIFYQIYQEI